MSQMIFINLPVADLNRSMAFYEAIGFARDAHGFWSNFTDRRRVDPAAEAQDLICVSRSDRAAVDALIKAAVAAGGTADPCPAQDNGFMYGRSFGDPDGHIWEPMWMSGDAAEMGPAETANAG